jgi:phage repressor protein C with HTH and peptisase S24 domain
MFRGDRLKALIDKAGISQSELARRTGVSQTAIWKLINEPGQGSKHTHRIAAELGTTSEYLMGEIEDSTVPGAVADRRLAFRAAVPEPAPDTVELPEFDLAYGLGASYIHDSPVSGKSMVFSRAWIRHFTDSPFEMLYWAHGIGDSMTPTIQDADVVLIDTAQRTPRIWDKLWALEVGGLGMIKRLRPTKDGAGMRLLSDGGQPEEVVYDEEMQVIGRVVAIVRKY